MLNHLLLEVFCLKENENVPYDCCSENRIPKYECLRRKCPYIAFTSCENAFCYADEYAEANEVISLGGEMLSNTVDLQTARKIWQEICNQKIVEAYEVYMEKIDKEGE